jgi:rod shape-determining protein MreC
MKTILNKQTIAIAGAAFLIAIMTIISINALNTQDPVTGAANVVTRPVRELASTIARTFGNIFAAMHDYEQLTLQNEQLLQQIARLERDYRDATLLAEENSQMRNLLNFRERHGEFESERVTLQSWGSDNFSSSFIINRGYANSDIRPGMGVTTEHGMLLGQVFEVGPTTSTIITIIDTKFSLAAFVGRGGETDAPVSVTARGDFALMRNGLLILDNIDDDLTLLVGDFVVTSGTGGVFPAGLILGEINGIYRHDSGIGRFATVRPMLDISSINTVFVITEFENPD